MIAELTTYGQLVKGIDSKISSVTVFLNRAQVHRDAKVKIESGHSQLVLKGLPSKIDPENIQVSGKGNFILIGINHRHNYLDEMSLPSGLKVLKDSLGLLTRSLSLDQSQKDILKREEDLLLSNQKFGGSNQSISVNEMKQMADFYRSRLTEITASRMIVDEKIKKSQQQISRLQKQINEQTGMLSRTTSEISVIVSAQVSTTIDLSIAYVVPDAGWHPVYDLRAKDASSPIAFSYKANVFQNTGEEWKNVKLSLSTANPNLGGEKPELSTWFLNFYAPIAREYKRSQMKPASHSEAFQDVAGAATAMEEVESISDYMETIQTTLNTEFRITLPYTVESAAKPTTVDIKNSEMKATYKYAVTPKLDNDAFLMAQTTPWEELNLLPGVANIFFEGTYVGKTAIDPGFIRDTLSISLGRDKRIVTKREKIKDLTSKNLIGNLTKEIYGYEISIRNTKQEAITILVEDQIPVTRNSEIQVNNIEAQHAQINSGTGKIVWKLTIQPNETKTVSYRFEVKYPKDKMISGL